MREMAADIFGELFDGDVAPGRILFESGEHNGIEVTLQASARAVCPFLTGNEYFPAAGLWRLLALNHRGHLLRLTCRHLIGPLPGEENIEQNTERVDIAGGGNLLS